MRLFFSKVLDSREALRNPGTGIEKVCGVVKNPIVELDTNSAEAFQTADGIVKECGSGFVPKKAKKLP
jgi:hypothetical protein